MGEEMTKALLLEKMDAARAAWEAVLAEVPEERMEQPGVAGEWSVKDVVAHATAWQHKTALDCLRRGLHDPDYAPDASEEIDGEEQNQLFYEQHRDRPLADILAEDRQVYAEIIERVTALSEEDLLEPERYAWADGPLWQYVSGDTIAHYPEHAEGIRAWLGAQKAGAGRAEG
jgi:hypothetical protein